MGDLEKQDERVFGEEEEKESLLGDMAVLDFDILCSTVALQTQKGNNWNKLGSSEQEFGGGVLRMWEGELLDCFDHRRIALESTCCPCYRFGNNMRRAGFGSCFIQGSFYLILVIGYLLTFIAFFLTKQYCFLYLGVAFFIMVGTYLGFFRTRMRKKFNIKDSDSSLDDCIYHLVCPTCTLCQESRTLEMNNVQDGAWHGRGDTICIGGFNEVDNAVFELHSPPLITINSAEKYILQKSANGSDES